MHLFSRLVIIIAFLCIVSKPALALEQKNFVEAKILEHMSVVPKGAQRVPMLTIELHNSCSGSAQLNAVMLEHLGLGNVSDIESMAGWIGDKRVTRSVSSFIDRRFITLRFQKVLLRPCETVSIDILVSFSPEAAAEGNHRFMIRDAKNIDIQGASVTLQSTQPKLAKVVAGESAAHVTVVELALPFPLSFGPKRIVSRFRIESDTKKDQLLEAITLTNNGSAKDADLQKLFVENAKGERLSDIASSLDGDKVRFHFSDPFVLKSGSEHLFIVRSDIRSSRRRTIEFTVEDPEDIEIRNVPRSY